MVTKEQCVMLGNFGGEVHLNIGCERGKVIRWRINGRCKTWKREPKKFMLPLKHGLYDYTYLTHNNAGQFHVLENCPLNK